MQLILKNGLEIEIVRDIGIGDLVTETADSSVIGEIADNLTAENVSDIMVGENHYTGLTCKGMTVNNLEPGFEIHIHLGEPDSDQIVDILLGGN